MVNEVKRKSLKTLAGVAAGAAAFSQAPVSLAGQVTAAGQSGLSIKHVETVFGQTVFVENLSDETVVLKSLTPGQFSTASGTFDLQYLLGENGLEVKAATTQAHNISHDGRLHNWAVWQTIETSSESFQASGPTRSVNVLIHDRSLAEAPRAVVHDGQFA